MQAAPAATGRVAAAHQHHLAAHAAQLRQRRRAPARPRQSSTASAAGGVCRASTPKRTGTPRPGQPLRQRGEGGTRVEMRLVGEAAPLRKRPARSGSSAAMPASSSVSWCPVRRAKRWSSAASRAGATTSVPRRTGAREVPRPPGEGFPPERHHRLLGALALAPRAPACRRRTRSRRPRRDGARAPAPRRRGPARPRSHGRDQACDAGADDGDTHRPHLRGGDVEPPPLPPGTRALFGHAGQSLRFQRLRLPCAAPG